MMMLLHPEDPKNSLRKIAVAGFCRAGCRGDTLEKLEISNLSARLGEHRHEWRGMRTIHGLIFFRCRIESFEVARHFWICDGER
jgi:hypothetical protein